MDRVAFVMPIILLIWLVLVGGFLYLVVLIIRALRKYLRETGPRKDNAAALASLGQVLRAHRTENNMTQEYVAERLGVSRQAVSKWENGTADPSTANLLALAKLYEVSADQLLREIQP